MGLVFWVVGKVVSLIFLLATAGSVACGLFYAAELAEEHAAMARKVLTHGTQAVVGLHVLLMLDGGVSRVSLLLSIGCHAVYSTLLPTFPFIQFSSVPFLASLAALGFAHYIWFSEFLGAGNDVLVTMGFFLVYVWLVPFAFFISISSVDEALPGSLGAQQATKGGGNLFKRLWGATAARLGGGGSGSLSSRRRD